MNNDNKLILKYRFPEFKEDGGWKNRNLRDLSNVVRGGSPRPIEDFLTNEISGLNWLKIADVSSDSKYITSTKERVIEEAASKTRIVNKGDLILSNSMSFGRPYILDITTCIHDGWIAISDIKSTEVEKDYLYYFISSDFAQKYFNIYAAGAAVKNLNAEIIKNLPIDYPNAPAEQQKIAACLSSMDDVIAGHEEKLTALEEHKKGLMQNLFRQEGETQPKYRFPEFENDGDWVKKKLGDVIELKGRIGYRGYTVEDIVNKGEGSITLSPSNIENNGSLNFDKLTYISWFKYEESPEIMLSEGFTVLVKTGSTYGKAAFIKNLPEKATVNPQIVVLKPLNINSYFLYLIVSNTEIQKQINETVVGGAIPTLSQDSILKFQFHLPVNNSEQQKIASVLSSVDELIVAQREKIKALKEHKKGLMQGLFPKIES